MIDAMTAEGLLRRYATDEFRLTGEGARWVLTWHPQGDESHLLALRGKPCLDRTERRPHIGGTLGRSLLDGWIAAGWLARTDIPRQVVLTATGRRHFQSGLGVPIGQTIPRASLPRQRALKL